MTINPRKVAPGWLLRWPKEAFQLMSRAWILWLGIAAFLAAASQGLDATGIFKLLLWPLGLFAMLLSTGFSSLSDHKFVTGQDVLNNFRNCTLFWIDDLKHRGIVLLLLMAGCLIGEHLDSLHLQALSELAASTSTASNTPVSPSNLWAWLLQPSPLSSAGAAMWFGGLFSVGGFFPGMSGSLRQAFGEFDRNALELLIRRAEHLNRAPVWSLVAFNIAVAGISEYIPVVGWLMSIFIPPLGYVAFREIFIDGNGNRKRAPRTSSSRVSSVVAGTA